MKILESDLWYLSCLVFAMGVVCGLLLATGLLLSGCSSPAWSCPDAAPDAAEDGGTVCGEGQCPGWAGGPGVSLAGGVCALRCEIGGEPCPCGGACVQIPGAVPVCSEVAP